ncbi:hypothetical protein BH10PLA2_BH10PLA2_14590 [soil metagenome]
MNCKVARRRLLSMVRPDQAPDEVQGHLSWCSDCREWHGRLVHLEKNVRRIPVPRSHKHTKQAFLDSFLAESTTRPPTPPAPTQAPGSTVPFRPHPEESPAKPRPWIARLAAAAISGFGWWVVRL